MYEPTRFEMIFTEVDQLFTALAAAQAAMPNAVFNRTNPHFRSQYADLAAIREATLPALTKHGIAITQFTKIVPEGLRLITIMGHKSGQWILGEYPITIGTPQSMGSQLTYARRYSWSAMTGVAADDDDDAEVAEGSQNVPRETGGKKTAYRARPDWQPMLDEMTKVKTAHALRVWRVANNERLNSWPDGWVARFDDLVEARVAELEEADSTEEGTPLKRQLQASLAEEGESD